MCLWSSLLCSAALILPFLLEDVQCLQMVAVNVPTMVQFEDEAKLSVEYKLDGNQLYSIKWYKDDMEFYRFVPSNKPAVQVFTLNDVYVDMARSINGTVFLQRANAGTTGMYRVEVSADAPTFQTVAGMKRLKVTSKNGLMAGSSSLDRFNIVSILFLVWMMARLC